MTQRHDPQRRQIMTHKSVLCTAGTFAQAQKAIEMYAPVMLLHVERYALLHVLAGSLVDLL